jgi:SAM-dependent methyltransferase
LRSAELRHDLVTDPEYLGRAQYAIADKLAARVALHDRFGTKPTRWHRWVFDQLDLRAVAAVLELGCGTGALWAKNSDRIPPAWDLALTDISRAMLVEARRATGRLPCPVTYALVDAHDIPYPDACFDLVVANHVLHHLADRSRAVAEARRVLRSGGRFYLGANAAHHCLELRELMAACVPRLPPAAIGLGIDDCRRALEEQFARVEAAVFGDELRIDDVEALLEYVCSTVTWRDLTGHELARVRAAVERRIGEHGSFAVRTATVLLCGRNDLASGRFGSDHAATISSSNGNSPTPS